MIAGSPLSDVKYFYSEKILLKSKSKKQNATNHKRNERKKFFIFFKFYIFQKNLRLLTMKNYLNNCVECPK